MSRVMKLVGSVNWGRRSGDLLAPQVLAAVDRAAAGEPHGIAVSVRSGVVTIRGEVDDMRDISRFAAAARRVPGVLQVDNLLRLRVTGRAARPTVLSA